MDGRSGARSFEILEKTHVTGLVHAHDEQDIDVSSKVERISWTGLALLIHTINYIRTPFIPSH